MAGGDLRKRIEALNKGPLRNVPEPRNSRPPAADGPRRETHAPDEPFGTGKPDAVDSPGAVPARPGARTPTDSVPPFALEDAVEGVVAEAPVGPGYYRIEVPAARLEAASLYLHRRFISLTGHPDGKAVGRLAAVCGAERLSPDEVVFLDIETTGLGADSPLFLIGTMECSEQGFLFRQYFARRYAEEPSVIAAASEKLAQTSVLVTFNGKSFDLPFIESRAAAHGVRLRQPRSHLDILHEARRCYRRDLPNCRLQTLEQMVCGRCREEDIPSAEIPDAYREFVRTGDARKVCLILRHNLFDLLTMADLMYRMWGRE